MKISQLKEALEHVGVDTYFASLDGIARDETLVLEHAITSSDWCVYYSGSSLNRVG